MDPPEPAIKFQVLRDQVQERVTEMLDQAPGGKMLALDPALIGPLSLVVKQSLLKDHGVTKTEPLSEEPLGCEARDIIIFIVRPTIENMKLISRHVNDYKANEEKHRYDLFMVPKVTEVCENVLTGEQVLGQFDTISDLPMFLIPLENDLLSLQLEDSFKGLVLDRDLSVYYHIALALKEIEHYFGPISKKEGKGQASSQILAMLKAMEDEDPDSITSHPLSEIQSLVLIDREVDLVTPFCTQFTYEALLDQVLGIQNSNPHSDLLKVNPKILEKDESDREVQLLLTSADTVFHEIRNLNFCVLKPLLLEKLNFIDMTYKERDQQRTIDELTKYMKRFKQAHKEAASVQNHLNLAIYITSETTKNVFFNQTLDVEHSIIMGETDQGTFDYIERLIGEMEPLTTVLRLLCLLSVTQNGIKGKLFDFFRREIVQTYGYQHLLTLYNLEKTGLLRKQESKSSWNQLKQTFRLIFEDVNQRDPNDIAYAYAGYAPLSLRLVEALYKTGWRSPAVASLPGEYYSSTYPVDDPEREARKPIVMLFFVGGVTLGEVAAVRYLNSIDTAREFVVASTHLINSATFLKALMAGS